jgi:predicted DNA-binding ribbon-helix-helix protein
MKSPIVKRSIVISGRKTSVSLEEAFWSGMKEISEELSVTLSELVGVIDTDRRQGNLSSAIRLFVLDHFKARAARPEDEPALRDSHALDLAEPSAETRDQGSG